MAETIKNEIATLKINLMHCNTCLQYARTKARIEEKLNAASILLDRGMISFDEYLIVESVAY